VVPAGPAPSLADLRAHLAAARMATGLWPDRLECMPELPKNSLGKIQRGVLRARLEMAAAGDR
jgi:non-ribosomal peptide synthetase component E (peptide arylation enzyme)